MFGMMEGLGNATTTTTVAPTTHNSKVTFDTTNIIGLVVWLLCILYNCFSSAVEVSKINNDSSEKRGTLGSWRNCLHILWSCTLHSFIVTWRNYREYYRIAKFIVILIALRF